MATFLFNGESPDALGIENFTRTRRSQGVDVLSMTFAVDAAALLLWGYGSTVTVHKDGVLWFSGTVDSDVRAMSDRAEGAQLTAKGAWWKLERTPYLLTFPFGSVKTVLNTGGRVALFVNPNTNAVETTRVTLDRILAVAASYLPPLATGSAPFLFPNLFAPPEKATDRSLAQALMAVLRYHPDWATYFAGTTLNFLQRGGYRLHFEIGNSAVQEARPVIRRDLVPAGFVLRYEREQDVQSAAGYRAAIGVDSWPVGVVPGEPGVIEETITLRKGEPVPTGGLARSFYTALATNPLVEGGMTLIDEGCDTGIFPGCSINLYGMRPPTEWASMDAFVVEVSETPRTGTTEVTFGLPGHLSFRDWADLMRFQNRWRTRDELASRDTPVELIPDTHLTGYVTRRNSDAAWVVRVTPGEVGDGGLTGDVPKWMETSTLIDNDPPPERLLVRGAAALPVYVYIQFEPEPAQFAMEDGDGNPVAEWKSTGVVDITDLRIRFAATGARLPEVDANSGEVTSGRFYRKLGTVTWPLTAPAPTFTPVRSGNFQLLHSPPNRFYFLAETAE